MATVEYQITVASKTQAGNYGDDGNAYFYNGQQAPMFQLYPGDVVKFMQEDASNDGHLLKLSLTPDGTHGGGSAYTSDVTHVGTPGNSGAYTAYVVGVSNQNLHYYCHNHSGMGGDIDVDHNQPTYLDAISRTDASTSLIVDNESALFAAAEGWAYIPTSDVSTANDTITLTGHGYENNYQVEYSSDGGTAITGLTSGNNYFIIKVDADTFKLSDTSGGSAKSLTGTGNDNQFIHLHRVAGVTETAITQLDRDLAHATTMAAEIDAMDDGSFNWSWIELNNNLDEHLYIHYHDVDWANNTIYVPNHGFDSTNIYNNLITYSKPANQTVINNLFNFLPNVFAVVVDNDNFSLSFFTPVVLAEPGATDSQVAETVEHTITVAGRDSEYGATGNAFYVDGIESPYITLIRGNTYKFLQADSSNSNHPLKLSTTDDGTHNSGSAISSGITYVGTPGSAGAYTQYVVPADAPDTLYYFCGNHSGMGSSISVADTGIGYTEHETFTFSRNKHTTTGSTYPWQTPLNSNYDIDSNEGPFAPTAAEKQLYLNKYVSHLTYLNGLTDWGSTNIDFIGAAITKANNISF